MEIKESIYSYKTKEIGYIIEPVLARNGKRVCLMSVACNCLKEKQETKRERNEKKGEESRETKERARDK